MKHHLSWKLSAILTALLVLLPLLAIVYHASSGEMDNLIHFWNTMLGHYVINSVLLVVGTVALALFFALPSAWLVANFQFWGQRTLQWLLCLPLAMPAYLIAYLYTDLLDYSGGFQSLLRDIFGWQTPRDYWFPQIRTLYGACFVLALVLYPYIFLLVRVAFLEQSENLQHSAKMLGATPSQIFRRITFPLIRPAIAVGMALVAMETLGDFGTVAYFAVPTLTTAIYDSWLSFHDLGTASRISIFMLMMIFLFISLEQYSRRKQKSYQRGYEKKAHLKTLTGWRNALALTWCWGLLAIAFFIPFGRLIFWSIEYFEQSWNLDFVKFAANSLKVSSIAAITTVCVALLLHFAHRLSKENRCFSKMTRLSLGLSGFGYAIPGTVLAIGLLSPLTFADHQLHGLLKSLELKPVGLIFSGSLFALVLAYTIRFLAMAIGTLGACLERISPTLDMASRSMGKTGVAMFKNIHIPLISKGMITAILMVFIESMKELNASLLLRPFNFDTLATYVFTFTSDEQLERAALPAIVLVLVGLIPVIWLTRSLISQSQKER
ncbi:iron ABC transporter permease [Rodentibacter caecimuris]|uniref:Iron ABC transporter permease n=1 Tax=Rodentibacter caecimuris TaxID=1796644 RepID=A0AAJ3K380_9PAST|nr:MULTISPECIES: iron ABC transporter permease [Pasteurellaceae]AOF53456.1 Ferric iron ABC transporter, permease protein [Pasteurellaceae bacterium NI1060]MCQ9124135.1 iron ABC transporter permease [Rodentibacter heylii]MCR1838015.1 iron ABC transporter permease [Pasteurella caecimuris]MCU0107672.1 iron ABC transporter permease [Pasteurella caecimuris]MCX2962355.1 iron ABC transporter permease [Rodentibacter heylii]